MSWRNSGSQTNSLIMVFTTKSVSDILAVSIIIVFFSLKQYQPLFANVHKLLAAPSCLLYNGTIADTRPFTNFRTFC